MAWTMPAKPHQSECLAHTGHTHSAPIICHTLIWNWNAVLRAFAIKGPCAWVGMCLWRVDFMLERNASTAFSAWVWAALQVTCNRQTTGSSKLSILMASMHFFCSSLWAASHSSWACITSFTYASVAIPHVLSMHEVGGGVHALHMTGGSLHCLLPGGHHHHHATNVVGVDTRHVT